MVRWLLPSLLLSACAHATPPQDDLGRLLNEQGLDGSSALMSQVPPNPAGTDLVVNAMGFIGVPYRRGGSSAESGFDCSGFVRSMYQDTVGLLLPRRAEEQAAATHKIDREELKPGDLVFFNTLRRTFSHVGIYIGNGRFIHAPRPGAHVRIEDMGIAYWRTRFNGARRVLLGGEPATTAGR